MSSSDRNSALAPIDTDLYDSIKKALMSDRPRILVIGGTSRKYKRTLLVRKDFCLFRFVEKGKNLRNLCIPKTVGCIVNARALGHANVEHVESVCPASVTIIPSVYDTGVINRVLLRILEEQPPLQREEKEKEPQMKVTTPPPATTAHVPEPPPPKMDERTLGDIVMLSALYAEMSVRSAGYAWISDKKTGVVLRRVCEADIETRDVNRRFIQKGWLLPRTLPGDTRVGAYGATEAGIDFLKSHGETVPDLWCPTTAPPEEVRHTPPSGLAAKFAELEQEIKADIGLDAELKAAEDNVENIKARIKDRDERKERLKKILALLDD